MYKVLKGFKDTDGKIYKIGDEYNIEDENRIELLSTVNNKYGYPFIEKLSKPRLRKKKDNPQTVED